MEMMYLAGYLVVVVATTIYVGSRGHDKFISLISGLLWPITWMILIAEELS